jgi:hypothetical protein
MQELFEECCNMKWELVPAEDRSKSYCHRPGASIAGSWRGLAHLRLSKSGFRFSKQLERLPPFSEGGGDPGTHQIRQSFSPGNVQPFDALLQFSGAVAGSEGKFLIIVAETVSLKGSVVIHNDFSGLAHGSPIKRF